MSNHNIPFSMPMYKDFVPSRIRPWIHLLFAFAFQFSGGIYVGSLDEIVGREDMIREDVLMCMYCTLGGMAIYFPLLFRMKFRFTNRTLLLASSLGIALCNFTATFIDFQPLLWLICFIAGCLKIQGTFECMSNIQLWMTPRRDFTVFFPILHIVILCSIQASDMLASYLCYIGSWEYMNLLMTGIMLSVALTVFILTRHARIIKKMPLYGIDWLGGVLWAVGLMQLVYIFNYGEFYNWFDSNILKSLSISTALTFAIVLLRMFNIHHPFIEPRMWTYKYLPSLLIIIAIVEAVLATEHVLEEVFYHEGLHYSAYTSSILNISAIAGILLGCIVSLIWMKVLRLSFVRLVIVGLFAVVVYVLYLYFTLSTEINIERLYFPVFARGFGYAVLSIVFITALHEIMSFEHFFQSLAVFNFMHMLIGGIIGSALYSYGLRYLISDNISHYGVHINIMSINPIEFSHAIEQIMIQFQMISIKQIYGIVAYISIFLFLSILLYDHPYTRSTLKKIPRWKSFGTKVRRGVMKRIRRDSRLQD